MTITVETGTRAEVTRTDVLTDFTGSAAFTAAEATQRKRSRRDTHNGMNTIRKRMVGAAVALAPGESAGAEMRWWDPGGQCEAVIQGAAVQTLPEDKSILVGATGPGGKPETSSLCGDLTLHYSGFSHD